MNKRKAVLATAIITAMLVVIDIFLYRESKSGFALLTGMVTVYGYYRVAVDFCAWLSAPDARQKQSPRFLGAEKAAGGKRA